MQADINGEPRVCNWTNTKTRRRARVPFGAKICPAGAGPRGPDACTGETEASLGRNNPANWATKPHASPLDPPPFPVPVAAGPGRCRRLGRAPAGAGGHVPPPPRVRPADLARRRAGGVHRHRSAQGREPHQQRPLARLDHRWRGAQAHQLAPVAPSPGRPDKIARRTAPRPAGGIFDLSSCSRGPDG